MKAFITTIAIAVICGGQIFCAAAQPGNETTDVSKAPTPSATVEAYAKATAAQGNSIALEEAFVARMADLGTPEMATVQAAALNQSEPTFGMAWAVSALAASHDERGDIAMTDLATAYRLNPNNVFVRQAAGHLMAWYDAITDKSRVPAAVQQDVAALKASLASDPVYADAYAQTKSYYTQTSSALSAQTAWPQAADEYGEVPSGAFVNDYVAPAPPPVAYDYETQPYLPPAEYAAPYYPDYYYSPAPYFYVPPVVVTPGFGGLAPLDHRGIFHAPFVGGGGGPHFAAPHFTGPRGGGFHNDEFHGGSFHSGGHRR